jgi:hypothetical protein
MEHFFGAALEAVSAAAQRPSINEGSPADRWDITRRFEGETALIIWDR